MAPPQFPIEQEQNALPAAANHAKKRQYAAGQTQAYQGTAETVPQYGGDPSAMMQPGAQPGGQLFTPGESAGFQHQQQAAPYFAPQDAQYQTGQPHAAMPPYQQHAAPMAQLGDQFGQMNLQGGQKPVRVTLDLHSTDRPSLFNRSVCPDDHESHRDTGRSPRVESATT